MHFSIIKISALITEVTNFIQISSEHSSCLQLAVRQKPSAAKSLLKASFERNPIVPFFLFHQGHCGETEKSVVMVSSNTWQREN